MGVVQSAISGVRRFSERAGQTDFNARTESDDQRANYPLTTLYVRTHAGGLMVPQFNTTLSVIAISRRTGQKKPLPIARCAESPSKFIVLFDEDDVYFELQVDNLHTPRHCGLLMVMNHRIGKYIIKKYTDVPIKSLEPSGRRFHFSRLAREKELEESRNHLKLQSPTCVIGHIGLSIRYSVPRQDPGTFTIRIKPLKGRHIFLEVCSHDNILSLKERIEEDIGFPIYEQRLIRDGKVLENNETLESYGVRNDDVIYLVRKLRHHRIAQLVGSGRVHRITFTPKIEVDNAENSAKIRFQTDDDIAVSPFLLELRMDSRNLGYGGSSGARFLSFLRRLTGFF